MMNLWPKQLTDDEVVEATRQNLNRSQKLRWLFLLYAVAFIAIPLFFAPIAYDLMEGHAKRLTGNQWLPFLAGLSFGVALGFVYILFVLKATALFILFLNPFMFRRKDRLLVEYYDQLHKSG